MPPRMATWSAGVLVLAVLTACGSGDAPQAAQDDVILFASYDFQENQILAEVYAEAVERAGLPVEVEHGIGVREVVAPALEQGVVDVVVEYLGTALVYARPPGSELPVAPEEMRELLDETMADRGVDVLDAARAEDQNGFAVTTAFASEHGTGKLSDLAPLAADLTFGGPAECPDRPLCLPGLREVYGLEFGDVRTMDSRAATVEALIAGQIDVGLLETTDARLEIAPVTAPGRRPGSAAARERRPHGPAGSRRAMGREADRRPRRDQLAADDGRPDPAEPGGRAGRSDAGGGRGRVVGVTQTIAPWPVIARPTIRVLTSRVPS